MFLYDHKFRKIQAKFMEYKDYMHDREVETNKFHCEEVSELRARIYRMAEEFQEREDYFETINETLKDLAQQIPKLVKEK